MTSHSDKLSADSRLGQQPACCADLGLNFPPIFKVIETITFEHVLRLRTEGLEENFRVAVGVFTHYTLNFDPENYTGDVEAKVITSLEDTAANSLLVRWYKTVEEAIAYLEGVADARGSSPHFILRTAYGAFTLVDIATNDMWSGPMIFYTARYPHADSLYGTKHFELSTAPGQFPQETQILHLVLPRGPQ